VGRRTQTHQGSPGGGPHSEHRPGPHPRPGSETQGEPELNVGPALVRTVLHFWPDFNCWLDQVPDRRRADRVVYHKRFLLWLGLALSLFKLGSRRQLDYELPKGNPHLLDNLNRLAATGQVGLPVNKTADDFLVGVGPAPLARLRHLMLGRLVRNKVLDAARVQGRLLVLIDATDYLTFKERHCPNCLTQSNASSTTYKHPVLEAKLLGPAGVVASAATVFLENSDADQTRADAGAERRKQDCELEALARLAPLLKEQFPQLELCINGDGLYACGTALALITSRGWSYVLVLKPGRLPSVWQDFVQLLELAPGNRLEQTTPEKIRQVYRWVNAVSYVDSCGREWTFNVLQCEETKEAVTTRWVWVTDLEVNRKTVAEVAQRAGRRRWCVEDEGFNVQKNSEMNLEHAYSEGEHFGAYYLLLQVAHVLVQLLEKGSLLRALAKEAGKKSIVALLGSLKNIAAFLVESLRNLTWPAEAFAQAEKIQIRLDSS
jgi:hypothetical protein